MTCVVGTIVVETIHVAISAGEVPTVQIAPVTTTIEVEGLVGIRGPKGEVGDTGPQGPPGANGSDIGQVAVTTPAENDLLRFNSGAWRNIPQTLVADGGNF